MASKWRVINLNLSSHRNAILVFLVGTIIFLLLSSIGSYEVYHYTESNEFCGKTCHTVMAPEFTTYQASPHARVKCVECHVGEGADWYVKSKLSGLYQVYSVLAKKYPQPIETPVHSLRPARETCEKCHWPEQFYPNQLVKETHFIADSLNTEWEVYLRMLIGPENKTKGLTEGIHWHINPKVKVEYIDAYGDREELPWVRYINMATGDTIIYIDTDDPPDEETLATAEIREMDCLDCHNRPSHQFLPPQEFTDYQISAGKIPSSLPFIKYITMEIMFSEYFEDKDTAITTISKMVNEFYETEHPDIYVTQKDSIDKAIDGILEGFNTHIFPYMKASWDAYPDHIGHKEFNGCFRCHNDRHESESGKLISKDCNLCHTILQQGPVGNSISASFGESLDFEHPIPLDEGWIDDMCSDCHRYLFE
jgi:hypothetical protein